MRQKDGDKISTSGRDPTRRRKYATDPAAYLHDILGVTNLTEDQEATLDLVLRTNRLLLPASNAVGKTYMLGGVGVWWMDAVASQLDEEGREQGALWLMTAPDANTVDSTIWAAALGMIKRAERNGYPMPGRYSELSVLWKIREDWFVEKLSPPKRVDQQQQHGASGRHHRNLLITIDEGPGVDHARFRAAEGMASGKGNKIVTAGNPTESVGPFYERATGAEYTSYRIHSFNHPNVIRRDEVISGGAISHTVIDAAVKDKCFDRGEWGVGDNDPDPAHHDFLYRLHPWVGTDQKLEIPDPKPADETVVIADVPYRILGHADAPIHVFRPSSTFLSSRLGIFPLESSSALYPSNYIDRAFELWLTLSRVGTLRELEADPYFRVGVDPAEEGGDAPMTMPLWKMGNLYVFGRGRDLERGLDHHLAAQIVNIYGTGPEYVVDSIGVGTGTASRLAFDYSCKVERFKASEGAWNDEEAGEPAYANKRAAAHWNASRLLRENRIAMPPNMDLKRELMAHSIEARSGKLLVVSKKDLKKKLGRSPDNADAWVMGLWEERQTEEGGAMYMPMGGRAGGPPKDYNAYMKREAA